MQSLTTPASAEKTLSRSFDASLRLIAEDLCAGSNCEVGLFDFRDELRGQGALVLAVLARHVSEINPGLSIKPLERAEMKNLWMSGVPFALVNCQSGAEGLWQLGGSTPGLAPCTRASLAESERYKQLLAVGARQTAQSKAAKLQMAATLSGLLQKVRRLAAQPTVTADQRTDCMYHLRVFGSKETIEESSLSSALEYLASACEALGHKLGDLVSL